MKVVDSSDERRKWLARLLKRKDPHARYFCRRCIRYLGAAGTCDCGSP